MKKKDWILIIVLLAAAGALWLAFHFFSSKGACAVARIDGKEVGRWELGTDTEEEIDSPFGHNKIRIRDGKVVMIEADCPDGYCMEQHAIGADGGTIICLPHHLVIGIEGAEESGEDVDAVVK